MESDSGKKEIRALIESWANAVSQGDMHGALKNHSEDIVIFDVPPPLQSKGIEEYKKTWELFFSFQPKGDFEVSELQITANDDIAFCHAIVRISEQKEPGVRLTMGLRKIDGSWLITHEHHSLPYTE